ncbi:TetR/AcrR family transcriptional regulator [Pseudomonas thivervalensis]|uniref:TetR/AcrR family transcriptional regulator n=1 Tax=Pseudomonas thivervalensis TaxID=86265 RepID=UPI0009E76CD7|nr:TetR/AcrR family transcriptional regulator [Pseudomonas thivervalensis]
MNATTLTPSTLPIVSDHYRLSTYLAIREKALDMFAEYGFQAVSLRKLAGAIGIQPGSLYCHIKNKHALLFELIEEHENDLFETLKTAIPNGPPCAQLKTYVWESLIYLTQHQRQGTVAKHETRHLREEQQNNIRALKNKRHSLLRDILRNYALKKNKQNTEHVEILYQCATMVLDNFTECSPHQSETSLHAYRDFIFRCIDDHLKNTLTR